METCPCIDETLKRRLRGVCPVLVLASRSPNRRKILEDAGVTVITRPQDICEICGLTEPEAVVTELSRQKFGSYMDSPLFDPSLPAIAVDTLVCLDGKLLGKPRDEAEAADMLGSLSGRWHEVCSGLSVYNPKTGQKCTVSDTTRVHFIDLDKDMIDRYIATGDCVGAAGAYKIQRNGYRLIDRTEGSLSNIIGLPLEKLVSLLS